MTKTEKFLVCLLFIIIMIWMWAAGLMFRLYDKRIAYLEAQDSVKSSQIDVMVHQLNGTEDPKLEVGE